MNTITKNQAFDAMIQGKTIISRGVKFRFDERGRLWAKWPEHSFWLPEEWSFLEAQRGPFEEVGG